MNSMIDYVEMLIAELRYGVIDNMLSEARANMYMYPEELRFNPYHDPSNGRFTSGGGSGSGVDKSGGKGYNRFRKEHNVNEYSELKEPMQMRHVKAVINDMGVDYSDIEIDIIRDEALIGKGIYGYTFPNGKRVQLYPDAFSDREQLVKTLGHERVHCEQIKLFGRSRNDSEAKYYEKGPTFSEEFWWSLYKERTGYNEKR